MKRIATLVALLFALTLGGTGSVSATQSIDDMYVKTSSHFKTGSQYVHFCHRTANVGHWVAKSKTPEQANGHISGTSKNHNKPVSWRGVPVEDFWASTWQVKNQTCGPKPPPKKDRLDPRLNIRVCGDPRLLITVNNRRSTVPVTYTFWFRSAKGGERTFSKKVAAGQRDVLQPRWVVGRSILKYTYSAPGFFTPAVINEIRLPASTPWGKGSCPANLSAAKRQARNQ